MGSPSISRDIETPDAPWRGAVESASARAFSAHELIDVVCVQCHDAATLAAAIDPAETILIARRVVMLVEVDHDRGCWDVEESTRSNLIVGMVPPMGRDMTPPALPLCASNVDLPTIGISGGPVLRHVAGAA